MYNEYFGFKEAPFSIAPDPRYLYMTAQHREALAHLVYGLNSEGGCILLTGEVGTGKTTICRCLLEQIPDQANVALVLNPKVNEIELLESICDELHISYPDEDNSPKTYTDRIYQFLIESNRRNEKTVLIIDEAQNLDSKVLEQLRLLTNLETNQRKLLQIIILGQPELLTILARNEMRQLAQRITARFHLKPLDRYELKAYISHRLAIAGQSIQLFPENSIKLLYKLSNGVPRLINILCDRALLGAYVENQYSVNPSIVKKAATEVFGELKNVENSQRNKRWLYPVAAITTLAIFAVLIVLYLKLGNNTSPLSTTRTADKVDPETATSSADMRPVATNNTFSNIDSQTTTSEVSSEGMINTDNIDTADNMIVIDTGVNDITKDTKTANDNVNLEIAITGTSKDTTTINSIDKSAVTDTKYIVSSSPGEATDNSENVAPGNKDVLDDINTIIASADKNSDSAYQVLFDTWNHKFDSNSKTSACKQARNFSLSCLFRQGNIDSLKAHNRPAVLTLINNRGGKRYITITNTKDDIATIYSNKQAYQVKLQDLERYWHGQFTLLWNKPEYYSSVITPGDRGDIIDWLKTQLENINNTHSPDLIIGRYDKYLIDQVKAFQSRHGITTDGIVGPVTIIHINNELGRPAPFLITEPIQTVNNQG